jgi:predicted DNA-binding protein (MmcQ/YjbR family)
VVPVTHDELVAYCLAKPGAWEDEPWDGDTVAKVGPAGKGKIFAFMGGGAVGIKAGANREEADEWLDRYPGDATVMAYIGRAGWNTLCLGGAIPDDEIEEAIDFSYDLVVAKLPKSQRPPT